LFRNGCEQLPAMSTNKFGNFCHLYIKIPCNCGVFLCFWVRGEKLSEGQRLGGITFSKNIFSWMIKFL
jgi:hypothetical protein